MLSCPLCRAPVHNVWAGATDAWMVWHNEMLLSRRALSPCCGSEPDLMGSVSPCPHHGPCTLTVTTRAFDRSSSTRGCKDQAHATRQDSPALLPDSRRRRPHPSQRKGDRDDRQVPPQGGTQLYRGRLRPGAVLARC